MTAPAPGSEPKPERVETRIAVARDGTVLAFSGKVEYGQGIRTGFARIVAEELHVSIDRVRVELGDTDTAPWDMGTFGSMSTAVDGAALRKAAIFAHALLLERASERLGVETAQLHSEHGIVCAADGRRVTFTELTQKNALTGEVTALPGGRGVRGPATDVTLRLEALEIVTGARRYPADVRLPGLVYGAVLHGPRIDARPESIQENSARAMPGVLAVVRDGDFCGVVAERQEQALAAIAAMHAAWRAPQQAAGAPTDLTLYARDGVDRALAGAARVHEAAYHVPHIAHAAMCPSVAVADVRDVAADLYVATQRPFGLRDEVAQALGMAIESVHIHPQAMGGMFGRGGMNDAPLEAARLSRVVGRPVRVQWTREEEFRLSPARPIVDVTIRAGLDASGRIVAWRSSSRTNPFTYGGAGDSRVLAMTSGRNAVAAYSVEAMEVMLHVQPAAIRTGAFRSLAAAPNIFAIESFMDELAAQCGQDPISFRLRHLDDPRLARVLELVHRRSRWGERERDGRALGVACAVYHGTYVAQIAEIRVPSPGSVRFERAWCAVDAGRLVHPDGARNQIEGGIQHAASCAMFEELTIADGGVATATLRDYPIAATVDAPAEIDVAFVDDPAIASTGIGEPGFVPTAAALANAIFAATGKRLRDLPLSI